MGDVMKNGEGKSMGYRIELEIKNYGRTMNENVALLIPICIAGPSTITPILNTVPAVTGTGLLGRETFRTSNVLFKRVPLYRNPSAGLF